MNTSNFLEYFFIYYVLKLNKFTGGQIMKTFETEIISRLSFVDANSVNMERTEIKKILDELVEIAKCEKSEKWILFLKSEWLYYNCDLEKSFQLNLEAYEIDKKECESGRKQNYYILNSLAVCYYCMKDYERALKCYKEVIKLEPKYYQAYVDIATVYRNIGKNKEAMDYIDIVLKNITEGDIYHQAIEAKSRVLMNLQIYEEANELLNKIKKEKEDDAEYLEALALSYIYLQKYNYAKKYFLKALHLCKDRSLKECLEMKLELTDFCSDIYDGDKIFDNAVARDMVLGLSRDRIQIIKPVFLSMKEKLSIGKKYCEQYKRQKKERSVRYSYNYILCLKGWSSSTPELSQGISDRSLKKGGGFYIRYNDMGIVIDPGINFFENLHENNLFIQDIDVVIISHNHIDHNNDLKKILDMNYQIDKNIIYIIDKETYSSYIKDLESIEKKGQNNVIKIFPDALEKEKLIKIQDKEEIKIEICPTYHRCEGSFGFKLILDSKVIGYTSDTRYTKDIGEFFGDSDVIIANISETNRDDLMLIKPKETHLGIFGVSELLKQMQGKKVLCLLTEFYGGFGDIRLEMASIVREYVDNSQIDIMPVDIGMIYFFDTGNFLCNNCEGMVEQNKRTVIRMGRDEKRLLCLCENCLYRT